MILFVLAPDKEHQKPRKPAVHTLFPSPWLGGRMSRKNVCSWVGEKLLEELVSCYLGLSFQKSLLGPDLKVGN